LEERKDIEVAKHAVKKVTITQSGSKRLEGNSGITKAWKPQFHRRSPAYTTDWDALPVVTA
jgi:hypothetical protein